MQTSSGWNDGGGGPLKSEKTFEISYSSLANHNRPTPCRETKSEVKIMQQVISLTTLLIIKDNKSERPVSRGVSVTWVWHDGRETVVA